MLRPFGAEMKLCYQIMLHDNFLWVDVGGGARIFVSDSEDARQLFMPTSDYFTDGTFKSCCRNFDQLYTIHGDIRSNGDVTKRKDICMIV